MLGPFLNVIYSFAISVDEERAACFYLCLCCHVNACALCLFLAVPLVVMRSIIVVPSAADLGFLERGFICIIV